FKETIHKLFGEELRVISLEDDSSNGVLESNVFSKSVLRFLVEMKNEIGTGSCDPTIQAGASFAKYYIQETYGEVLKCKIGKAPKLLYINKEVVDGFYMVVIDYVEAKQLYNCDSLSRDEYKAVFKDIEKAIGKLHEENIVFADLCDFNILVNKSQDQQYQEMLIDFDWA
ncbi:18415_t:CDS:2, partial [Racocetra fulgida]